MKSARIVLTLALACLLFVLLPLTALAADTVARGECGAVGDNLTWTLDSNGVLRISGSGDMKDWPEDVDPVWYDYTYDIRTVIVEEGVTGIGVYAFWEFDQMTSVTLPESLQRIGDFAFTCCESLPSITIPAGVAAIGKHVFGDDYALREINVAAGNTHYESEDGILFTKGKTELICYPNSKEDATYTVPDTVKIISGSAFYGNEILTSVTLPAALTEIGDWAFSYCSKLTTLGTIPATVSKIGKSALVACSSMTELKVAAENPNYKTVDGVLFNTAETELICYPAGNDRTSYSFPASVEKIASSAFSYAGNLTSVILPNGLKELGGWAFNKCYKLTTVNIPNTVTKIGESAFYCCAMESVVIPDTVTEIGIWAFADNESLRSVTLPAGLKKIDEVVFSGCTALSSVNIPESVEEISYSAFYGCALQNVVIPDNVKEIGSWAFGYNESLSSVIFPAGLQTLGYSAFFGCSELTAVTIPAGVTEIRESVFGGCTALTEINVDAANPNYKTVDDVLFTKDGKELLCYPAGKSDTVYFIPLGVEKILQGIFYRSNLTAVFIPRSVTYIDSYAFDTSSALLEINVDAANPSFKSEEGILFTKDGKELLCYPAGKSEACYRIPYGVEKIGINAFSECKALNTVVISDGVCSVDEYAFYDCSNLSRIIIPESVTDIADGYVFYGCDALTVCGYENSFAQSYAEEYELPFEIIQREDGSDSKHYTVTVPDAAHGSVTASAGKAASGKRITLTVTPDKGYTLETLTVTDAKGREIELTAVEYGETYTFKMPASRVEIAATFMEDNTMLNYFADVNAADYFYDAALWAAENGITAGVDDLHFAPYASTTRAQLVCFLWRAAGCPEPAARTCAFADVKGNAYYYKAVIWAVEQGIARGTSAATFTPDATVTRAQAVTFLGRMQGVADAASGYTHSFADVAAMDYYNNAVAWAAAQDITAGTDSKHFSPDRNCLRGEIVCFLYRCLAD